MAVYNTTNIPDVKISRLSSGHGEIDWLLGSKADGWGLVKKSLTLWGGEAGVGKTRFINGLCKMISKRERVLFYQLEMTVQSFRNKYLKNITNNNYFISDSSSIVDQVAEIKKYGPSFVVIDSINKVKEFTGSDKTIKECEAIYRSVASQVGCHIALITHLNAEGTVKGGTGLPHMVDTVITLSKNPGESGAFFAHIPDKNRYGIPGKRIELIHRDRGIQVLSENRFSDEGWIEPPAPFVTQPVQVTQVESNVSSQAAKNPGISGRRWPEVSKIPEDKQSISPPPRIKSPSASYRIFRPFKRLWRWLKEQEGGGYVD